MTPRALVADLAAQLAAAGVDSPRRTAEWIVEEAAGLDRAGLFGEHPVPDEAATRAVDLARRRAAGEPVQYVLGHAHFYGLQLEVSPAVLIPRPETEEVVEIALACLAGIEAPWVLDVGTGSGAIALAIAHERPDATVVAVDVSADALDVAQRNASRLGADVTFVRSDALAPAFADAVPPAFDLIVSNPPYVPDAERDGLQREVRDHEPAVALFVRDADPLAPYRALAGHATRLLRPGGWLVVETHADQGTAVARLFANAGLEAAEVRRDLAGRERIARARVSV